VPDLSLQAMSRFWTGAFRVFYRLLRWLDPLVHRMWEPSGYGNIVEFRVRSRTSGRERELMLGLLNVGGQLYLGHPNGPAGWTRDLDAAGSAEMVVHGNPPIHLRGVLLGMGAERDAVIDATNQHPFPGNLMYRVSRSHIRAVGRYYRLEPETPDTASA
jgi:hypothetical protein